MSDSIGRELRLSRQVYRLRALGLVTGGIAVATVFDARQTGWLPWIALALNVFVWPPVAWHLARTSRDPHRMERANLTVDSAFGGMWIALMHFNLLPSVLIVTMMSMDKIGWGPRFLARTSAAMAAACAAGMLLTGFRVEPATSMREIVASLPLMVAYPLAVAFASYHSGRLTRERNRQTAALREQLAHAARVGTLGEMAAGLAHELNQPLTAIHFEAGAALEDNVPDEMRRALAAIAGHSLRAGDIVRRMRTFARRGEPTREPTDIRQLIRDVLALLAHDLRLNGVQTREVFDPVPVVLVDRIELQQVMVNLIRNAMEAMLATPSAERRLSIETRPAGERVRVSVSDSGHGVDPAIAATLFHPFHTTKPSGLGLGLSICQSLIEGHAGRIGTAPSAGRGTTFFFELPAAPPAGTASWSLVAHAFIVDDEEMVRTSLSHLLRAIGIPSTSFPSGEAFLEHFSGDEQGCLIVDIRMPGMSGLDMLEALQQRGSALPTIVMTGHTDEGSVRRLAALSTLGLLEKPFSVAQLKDMLRRAAGAGA